jgi:hypothetical protein
LEETLEVRVGLVDIRNQESDSRKRRTATGDQRSGGSTKIDAEGTRSGEFAGKRNPRAQLGMGGARRKPKSTG